MINSSLRYLQVLCLFILTILSAAFPSGLVLVNDSLLVDIDPSTNCGSTGIHLRNESKDSKASVYLYIKGFTLQQSKKKIFVDSWFSQIDTQKKEMYKDTVLFPKKSLFMTLNIKDFNQFEGATADLFNDNVRIGVIRLIRSRVPFNVSIVSKVPNLPEIAFEKETNALLFFKNDDAIPYPVKFSLYVDDASDVLAESTFVMPARSTIPVSVVPMKKVLQKMSDKMNEIVTEGNLILQHVTDEERNNSVLMVKTLPVKISINGHLNGNSGTLSMWVFLALGLGGAVSLFVNFGIPNLRRREVLFQLIDDIAAKTRTISCNVPSSLRVFVRVERLRLYGLVKSIKWYTIDAEQTFDSFEKNISALDKRVSLIQNLDRILEQFSTLGGRTFSAPVKILDDIKKRLDEASGILLQTVLEDKCLQQAQEFIDLADNELKNVDTENKALAELMASRLTKLRSAFDENCGEIGALDKCKLLRTSYREVFDPLKRSEFENKDAITPEHYHWLSHSIERLQILTHYIRFWENADAERKLRIEKCEKELFEYLNIRTWNALHQARLIRWAVEENIFAEDLESELASGAYSVVWTPILPVFNQPVLIEINFNNEKFNTSKAIEKFTCQWDFGIVGKEEGCKIWHYFRNEKEAEFSVSFRNNSGQNVAAKDNSYERRLLKVSLQNEKRNKVVFAKAFVELIKTAVVIFVVTFGLYQGAKDQFLKLDMTSALIATFMMAFSADAIKNLITKRTS